MDMACIMGMDMEHGHGHAAWTWTRSTDFAAWIPTVDLHECMDAWMPECLNADKRLSPASLVFR
jgi:hypothetical protein